ncbi:sigma 54-interacting transcriptional regulator [Neobacillus pocheonensis]|uniref:Sigma 54-interacting transcriptional regulator n=1 Tax=Neobacillus pocheonensis TaxID=363869 RepID=A0ABT0WD81_9BACI|nr:sigma 54-interacting transcriptional regulator [Neobacillus pocheonensis]
MLIADLMDNNFSTCTIQNSILDGLKVFSIMKSEIMPIVNNEGVLIGILSRNRLIKALADGYQLTDPIKPLVNYQPVYMYPEYSSDKAYRLSFQHKIGHAPVVNNQMQPVGMLSTSQTIYSYEKTNRLLQSQLRLLFDNLHFGLFAINTEMQIIEINPLAKKILNIPDKFNYHLSELSQYNELIEIIQSIIIDKKVSMKKKLNINGYSIFINSYPIIDQQKLIGAMVIMDDLTNLEEIIRELRFSREWEEKLRSVVELAYDGLILVNNKGDITMVNKGFCELFSVDEKQLIGKSILKEFPELRIEDTLKMEVRVNSVAKIINERQCLITILPIKIKDQLVGAICKITFRGLKQLQDALNKVNKLEEKVNYYQKELNQIKSSKYSFADIIGESERILKVKKEAFAAAQSRSTVLLLGESGTGKELFAHGIHTASAQTGLLIQVNCAAIPGELLESEFFGYAEGAFTGAKKGGKKGKFELAKNGTIFLDEIGDMPMQLQTKLLRVLQEKEFEPIGSHTTIRLDTKVIAATNKNLKELIREGKFREDLYYRLDILQLEIPPLRERIEDIPDIVESIIERLNHSGFYLKGIDHSALSAMLNYTWPGNIRELQNVLERAANLTTDGYINMKNLPDYLVKYQDGKVEYLDSFKEGKYVITESSLPENVHEESSHSLQYREKLNDKERELIISALEQANGNKAKASRILGISRPWLYAKIKKYNLE